VAHHNGTSLNRPTTGLCVNATGTTPYEGMAGEPGSLAWKWKCGDLDCYAYIPTATVSCESVQGMQIFLTR